MTEFDTRMTGKWRHHDTTMGIMQFQRLLKGVFDKTTTRSANTVREADAILDTWDDES